ncbi:energy-coupling factor ABC transporter ATP-binding protein [Bifidobacterium callitrichos]|uniref:energy-coupling factor ABC transporter ATP-binding protein n=1 Tax=Bifidobacterium callitrichos TaxID=762209 RepID=UPI001CC31663|nr:ABC transporter ATP-binding protein [Bifidobacterium callitrichos]
MVELSHVRFAYADTGNADAGTAGRRTVLSDFNLTVERGECVALLGPNGIGKTTVMRIVNALDFPDSGEYRFGGTLVTRAEVEKRNSRFAKALHQRIGFVFQNSDTQLFCPSVGEEIAFGPTQMGLPDAEVDRRVNDIVTLFDLERFVDRAPYRLSGGEKKRVAVACVMSMNPDLMVLDEPTDGLDEENTALVVRVLKAYVEAGKTVLLSTHHHDIVEALDARIVRMSGRSLGPL